MGLPTEQTAARLHSKFAAEALQVLHALPLEARAVARALRLLMWRGLGCTVRRFGHQCARLRISERRFVLQQGLKRLFGQRESDVSQRVEVLVPLFLLFCALVASLGSSLPDLR